VIMPESSQPPSRCPVKPLLLDGRTASFIEEVGDEALRLISPMAESSSDHRHSVGAAGRPAESAASAGSAAIIPLIRQILDQV